MKINDFSIPRRMSKSAFVIYFVKALRNYASIILILFTVRIFDSSEETSIMEYIIMLLPGRILCHIADNRIPKLLLQEILR